MRKLELKTLLSKSLSSLLVFSLLAQATILPTPVFGASYGLVFSSLIPPSRWGALVDARRGIHEVLHSDTTPDVIVIEDLHFNYSVQKNIARLLQFLNQKGVLGTAVAVEGAVGPVDTHSLTDVVNPKVRAELADFLLKNGELTGSQLYSILSGQPSLLQGVEDPQYFLANRQIFKESYAGRMEAQEMVHRLIQRLETLPRETPHAAAILEELRLAERALAQQTTLEEIRKVSSRMDRVAQISGLLQADLGFNVDESVSKIREALQASVDFYVAALMRNRPMLSNTLRLLPQNAQNHKSTVFVVGGFHASFLERELARQGLSYAIFMPGVDSHTSTDERLYVERYLGVELTAAEAALQLSQQSGFLWGSVFDQSAGLIPSIPKWFDGLRNAAILGGSLKSAQVMAWISSHRKESSPPPYGIASIITRSLYEYVGVSFLGIPASISLVLLSPLAFIHGLGHVIAAIPEIRRGELRVANPWRWVTEGIELIPPKTKPEDERRNPRNGIKSGGIIANLATLVLLLLPSSPIVIGFVAANVFFVVLQRFVEEVKHSGELYSQRYAYSRSFRELLSREEGIDQIDKAISNYLLKGDMTQSQSIAVLHLDRTFNDIVEKRMGEELSMVMRRRIYRSIVNQLRNVSPSILVSETADPNTILILTPAKDFSRARLWNEFDKAIKQISSRWTNQGYAIADIQTGSDPAAQSFSNVVAFSGGRQSLIWKHVRSVLQNNNIYLSEYAGGTALVMFPPHGEIKGEPPDVRPEQFHVNKVLEEVNEFLRSNNIRDPTTSQPFELSIDLSAGEAKFPSHPITMSINATALHKIDELIAWDEIPEKMEEVHSADPVKRKLAMIGSAQEYLEKTYPATVGLSREVNPDRQSRIMGNLDRVLESMRADTADDLGVVAFHRHLNSGNVINVQVQPDAAAPTRTVGVLPANLTGQVETHIYRDPGDPQAQRDAQVQAEINLENLSALLSTDKKINSPRVRAYRRAGAAMRRGYRDWIHEPASSHRTDHVYISGASPAQSHYFGLMADPSAYNPRVGNSIHSIPNPVAPRGMPYFGRADGSGMALLNVTRDYFTRLVSPLEPGRYNFREIMGDSMPILQMGAGNSTRNMGGTVVGKFEHKMFVERSNDVRKGNIAPAKFAEVLLSIAAILQKAFPREAQVHSGQSEPVGAMVMEYGDNGFTIDESAVRDVLRRVENPDIRQGFNFLVRPVDFKESVDFGSVVINDLGQIIKFVEKPGEVFFLEYFVKKGFEKDEAQRKGRRVIELVKDAYNGVPEEALDSIVQSEGLGDSFIGLRRDLFKSLRDDGLISKTGDGTGSILMNAGIMLIGTGTLILLMRMAGIDMTPDGDFVIPESRAIPLIPQENVALVTEAENLLITLLTNLQGKTGEDLRGSIGIWQTNVPIVDEILFRLGKSVEGDTNPESIREKIESAISDLGDHLSLFDELLRSGIELDISKHFATKIAMDADYKKEVFGHVKVNSDLGPEYQEAAKELQRLQVVAPEDAIRRLEVLIVKRRHVLASGGMDISKDPIHKALTITRANARLWGMFHAKGAIDGAGKANGISVDGPWLDFGGAKYVRQVEMNETERGRAVNAAFGLSPYIHSGGDTFPGYSSGSYTKRRLAGDFVDPHSIRNDTLIQINHPSQREFIMDLGTKFQYTSVPWPFHLFNATDTNLEGKVVHRQADVTESVINLKADLASPRQFVSHLIWSFNDIKPGDEPVFFGEDLRKWLAHHNVEVNLWPSSPSGEKPKETLFTAKLFPAISAKLMEAALSGVPTNQLRRNALDDLDWDLFQDMPEIWDWLQHRSDAPPVSWIRAAEVGRLVSAQDHKELLNADAYKTWKARRFERIELLIAADAKNQRSPEVLRGSWLTDSQVSSVPSVSDSNGRHVTADESRLFGRWLGVTAGTMALLSLGGVVALLFASVPAVLPWGLLATSSYAMQGHQFLMNQSSLLEAAREEATSFRREDPTQTGPTDEEMNQWKLDLQSTYETTSVALQFIESGEIYYKEGVIYVDPLVAFYAHQMDSSTLHSILSYHEPAHRLFAGETIPYLLQAWTSTLYLAGRVQSPRARRVLAFLAPLLLPFVLLDRIGVVLVKALSRLLGHKSPDEAVLKAMKKNEAVLSTLLVSNSLNEIPPPSSGWLHVLQSLGQLYRNTQTSRAVDEMLARKELALSA